MLHKIAIGLVVLFAGCQPVFGQFDAPDPEIANTGAFDTCRCEIEQLLRDADPLPKVHYSFPVPGGMLLTHDPIIVEYARITHALTLNAEAATPAEVRAAIEIIDQVNADQPSLPCRLAITYSPWHKRGTEQAEIDLMRRHFERIAEAAAAAGGKVAHLVFDTEVFTAGDPREDVEITRKTTLAVNIAREYFPDAGLDWYGRGEIFRSASKTGWSERRFLTLDEPGDAFSCALYRLPELGYMRDTFRRTAAHAAEHGVHSVTPWVALGSGYRRADDRFQWFAFVWNYELIYSYQMGMEINHPWFGREDQEDRYAPWRLADRVIFYPQPFKYPHFGRHFVAYVNGANRRPLPRALLQEGE